MLCMYSACTLSPPFCPSATLVLTSTSTPGRLTNSVHNTYTLTASSQSHDSHIIALVLPQAAATTGSSSTLPGNSHQVKATLKVMMAKLRTGSRRHSNSSSMATGSPAGSKARDRPQETKMTWLMCSTTHGSHHSEALMTLWHCSLCLGIGPSHTAVKQHWHCRQVDGWETVTLRGVVGATRHCVQLLTGLGRQPVVHCLPSKKGCGCVCVALQQRCGRQCRHHS
jgi:hypothetical protein